MKMNVNTAPLPAAHFLRSKKGPICPSGTKWALAAGLLEDGERALFLARKNALGQELLEIPCVEVMAGGNPVAALCSAFRAQTGIDAEVHEILFQRRHNAGTRKRRAAVPVLVFKVTAKSHAVRPAQGFCGYRWLAPEDMAGKKLSRKSEWLRA